MDILKAPLGTSKQLFREHRVVPPEPFTAAEDGQITIGEIHTQILSANGPDDAVLQHYLQSEGEIYPHVSVPESRDSKSQKIVPEKPATLTGLAGLTQSWVDWFQQTLSTDSSEVYPYRYDSVPQDVDTWTKSSDGLLGYIRSSFNEITYLLRLKKRTLYANLPWPLRQPKFAKALCFSWHKYKAKFAVALPDNTIHIFDLVSRSWSPIVLKHEFMRDIQCIEWKPLSGNTLAVGTRYGVCVWDIISKASQPTFVGDSFPIQSQDQTAWMRYWQYPNQAPVNALSWCPKGQYLATGSVSSGEVVIWDTASGSATPLFEVLAAGIVQLRWSPSGDYLMAASAGGSVRVWEAFRWSSDKWVDFPSFAQSVAWCSADYSSALLTVAVQSTLHFFRFQSKDTPNCQGVAIGSVDFSKYVGRSKSGKEVNLCGRIHQVVWDPTGSRIAVSFFDSPLIGVLSCRNDIVSKLMFDIQPLGFIQGPRDCGSSVHMEFRENCNPDRGALLGVLWESGRVSLYPMYFKAHLLREPLKR